MINAAINVPTSAVITTREATSAPICDNDATRDRERAANADRDRDAIGTGTQMLTVTVTPTPIVTVTQIVTAMATDAPWRISISSSIATAKPPNSSAAILHKSITTNL